MSSVPFLDLGRQTSSIRAELNAAIDRVLSSGHYVLGPELRAFEDEFAGSCGVGHAVGVASGTDAIRLALEGCGVGPGDEVVTVANAGTPTVTAIAASGATPVLVDVEPDTMTMDVAQLTASISPRTKALVPVHLYGQCADMSSLMRIARAHQLRVIEDCAQAHGASYRGRVAGTIGDAGCFSFYPTKNLGALGDAGMVVTRDEALAAEVRSLRTYGWNADGESERPGTNSRLDEFQAAILRVKMRYVDGWSRRRREIAEEYARRLAGSDIRLPIEAEGRRHVYHLFVIRSRWRDQLRARLGDRRIETLVHYSRAVHEHRAWKHLGHARLAESERAAREVLSLPLYPEMTPSEITRVADAVAIEAGRAA